MRSASADISVKIVVPKPASRLASISGAYAPGNLHTGGIVRLEFQVPPPSVAGPWPPPSPLPERPRAAAGWQVWLGLWIVYLVWGSTYLAIRVVVETVPPFLSAGVRFVVAGRGDARVPGLAPRARRCCGRRARSCSPASRSATLLMGANAVVSVAEVDVPSSMAALLIALGAAVGDPLPPRARRPRRRASASPPC